MSRFTLKPFQEESVGYNLKNEYVINAIQQGLGKSLIALQTANELKAKTLIVVPAYLIIRWVREIQKFFPDKVYHPLTKSENLFKLWDCDFAIVSYNFLKHSEILFEWANLVVFDEAHSLKSMKAQRTNLAHKFIYENNIKRCLMLTGTPIQNRVYEFYSLIALANYNPKKEESAFLKKFGTYVDFANYFSYLREFEMNRGNKRVKVQQWEGIKNEDELKKKKD